MRLIAIGYDLRTEEVLTTAQALTLAPFVVYHNGSRPIPAELRCDQLPLSSWQDVLDESELLAVVVAKDDPEVQPILDDLLRLLAQNGTPLLLPHPACDMIMGFELQMIQQDSQALIGPWLDGLTHPIWQQLQNWTVGESSPIGVVERLDLQRVVSSRSQESVLEAFTKDALWLRALLGRVEKIQAIGVDVGSPDDWSQLVVTMTGPTGTVAQWSSISDSSGRDSRLELVGEQGAAEVTFSGPPEDWSLAVTAPQPIQVAWETQFDQADCLSRFGKLDRVADIHQDWDHACRAVELADAVHQSCRRGKTIALHHEQHSEQSTFKGMMAAGGCFMLLGTLGIMAFLWALQTARPSVADWPLWTFLWRGWLTVLVGFLSLQLLWFVFNDRQ